MTYTRPTHTSPAADGSATDLTVVLDALSDGLEAVEAGVSYLTSITSVADLLSLSPSQLWSSHRTSGLALPIAPASGVAALETAVALGAPIVDVDAQMTADGVMVIQHDSTWDDVTDQTGNVADTPYAVRPNVVQSEFFPSSAWPAERVLSIREFLGLCRGRAIPTIEVKGGIGDVPTLVGEIVAAGMQGSAFLNTSSTVVAAAIVSAGLHAHVWGCTTVGAVQAADAAGAWLIEVPYDADSSVRAAAAACVNVKRFITAPIQSRWQRDIALSNGIQGFVSDNPGWIEGSGITSLDVTSWLTRTSIPPGTYSGSPITEAYPLWSAGEFALSLNGVLSGYNQRSFRLPLELPAADYSLYVTVKFSAYVGDTNARTNIRVMCPSDEGTLGGDVDTRGYVIGLRKTGVLNVWVAPVGYGAGTLIASPATTAISDSGATVQLRVDVTSSQLRVTRTDTSQTTGWITNSAWRGPVMWVNGETAGTASHLMTLTESRIGTLVST